MLQTIALAAGLAASASIASAAGQVGQRYLSATLDGVFWDDDTLIDDAIGGSLRFNQPLSNTLDLGLGYSHLNSDIPDLGEEEGGSINSDLITFGATVHSPVANGKLFGRAEIGWASTDVDNTDVDSDDWVWGLTVGLELPVGQRVAVTPYVAYQDGFDSDVDGGFDFGVIADFDLTNRVGLVLDASINDDSDIGVKGGLLFRF